MVVYKPLDFKIALFIDAENVSYNNAGRIIDILEKQGKILVREIVADWTKINVASKEKDDNISGWRQVAATSSMTAIQQFTYRPKKNSSDIALAIRAMKTLYEKPFIDLYCIVSNDCDFTRLAQELREHDKIVIGMGEKEKSIEEFVKAFSEYVYLDERLEEDEEEASSAAEATRKTATATPVPPATRKKAKKAPVESIIGNERLSSLTEIIRELVDERGRALYSNINGLMKNKYPDFVPQNFGCKNFRQLMDAIMPDLAAFEKISTNDDFALVEKKK